MKDWVRRWGSYVVAGAIGASLVGIAVAHPVDKDLVHSGHSDAIDGTLSARNFRYKPAKQYRLNVSGLAFTASDAPSDYQPSLYGGVLADETSAGAPVNLPAGATITKVSFFWEADPTVDDTNLRLQWNDDVNSGGAEMAEAQATPCAVNPCSASDTSIVNAKVSSRRVYGLEVQTEDGVRILKAVISYKLKAPAPPG